MRICIVFDCLYPYTVGGAERWYRNLSERLARDGHELTYLTVRHWPSTEEPLVPGVRVLGLTGHTPLYTGGRRSIAAQLRFSGAVLRHLLHDGSRYDVVHTAGLHLFMLAVLQARRSRNFRIVADWHEVWTREYWREYLGPAGEVAWRIQLLQARSEHRAFCFAELHAERLRQLGYRGVPVVLKGEYAGPVTRPRTTDAEPLIVFAGRHIPEKRVLMLVPAIELARESVPELRGIIFGDGPEREKLLALIRESSLEQVVAAPGFVDGDRVEDALGRALCMVLPSRREGYGLVVVEAAAKGTPSIIVADPDNAATELIAEGENGFVAPSASPADLASAILLAHRGGRALRESTANWFAENARMLSLESSIDAVVAAYAGERARRP